MNQQEFEQKIKEMQEKLNKAVDLLSMECMITQLGYTVRMDDVIKKPFHVLCENTPEDGGISVGISGNKMQLYFAIATILHHDGEEEFYHNLTGVIAAEEVIQRSRQLDIQICSCGIALWRYWGWKQDRLSKLYYIQQEIWDEVGADNNISMLQLLDEECDIELTNHEGVSYKEFKFLNVAIDDGHDLSPQEWIIMRQKPNLRK